MSVGEIFTFVNEFHKFARILTAQSVTAIFKAFLSFRSILLNARQRAKICGCIFQTLLKTLCHRRKGRIASATLLVKDFFFFKDASNFSKPGHNLSLSKADPLLDRILCSYAEPKLFSVLEREGIISLSRLSYENKRINKKAMCCRGDAKK
ncbi:MAG: hypothetical protein ABIU63_16155 [Chitinophagaceae bacterium]